LGSLAALAAIWVCIQDATLWDRGAMLDLGTLGGNYSFATGINNRGLVVGWSQLAGVGGWDQPESHATRHAFVWDGNAMVDLNTQLDAEAANAGWVLLSANGVNDAGAIVGQAENTVTGERHAYLLSTAAVPEPATYALLLAGLGLVGLAARRRLQP
jgi:probable HAF family extracellular repeat protein